MANILLLIIAANRRLQLLSRRRYLLELLTLELELDDSALDTTHLQVTLHFFVHVEYLILIDFQFRTESSGLDSL